MIVRFAVILTVVVATMVSQSGSAEAKRLKCKAGTSSESRIGFRASDTVVISSESICKFAVNGVSAGSPPQIEISNAAQLLFLNGNIQPQFDTRAFATYMLAAGPDNTPDRLQQVVSAGRATLDSCISRFNDGDFNYSDRNRPQPNAEIICGTVLPQNRDALQDQSPPDLVIFDLHISHHQFDRIPYLYVGIEWDGGINVLITPYRR